MSGNTSPQRQCPNCGFTSFNGAQPTPLFYRPWHVRSRSAVKAYVESLGEEAREWLLALYVDNQLNLLAVDTIARGDKHGVDVHFWRILSRGHLLKASGFILVHNHPSGNCRPSETDKYITRRLSWVSRELDIPILGHFIIAGDKMEALLWD